MKKSNLETGKVLSIKPLSPVFAGLVRVSTESQAEKGESLSTQTKQIIKYVKDLGGREKEIIWFKGQEHSTPMEERIILDDLLNKSSTDLFDAVILTHLDRLGRDTAKNKEVFRILRDNDIRFFAATQEYNLWKPTDKSQLGILSESAEFFAQMCAEKSMENRLERARRGCPTTGVLPYARTFDKKDEVWGLDPEKLEKMVEEKTGELLQSERKYKVLYDTIKDGIAAVDIDGVYVECNQTFSDVLGYSKYDYIRGFNRSMLIVVRSHHLL